LATGFMKFLSIKEFFYKLNTIGFTLLLVPILAFIFLYYMPMQSDPIITDPATVVTILGAIVFFFVVDLTVVRWIWGARMRKLRMLLELAAKMDGYYRLVLLRKGSYCGFSLLLAIGFYLTANPGFTIMLLLIVVVSFLEWPSPTAFCRQFELDGNERDMVLKNLDMKAKKR